MTGNRPARRNQSGWRSRVRPLDALAGGTVGLRSRRARAALTSIGIAIGIASMIAVVGISASSKADLIAEIDRLGTNLLKIEAGQDIFGDGAKLPVESPAMVRRVGRVQRASSVSQLATDVQRNQYVDDNNGIDVVATEPDLLDTLEGTVAHGRFLDERTSELPTTVLGSVAAQRLGITDLDGGPTVRIAGIRFAVIGILDPLPLNPDVDRSVLVGNHAASDFLGADVIPTGIFLRAEPTAVESVRVVLARTVNPADPNEVSVSRPSDALQARAQIDESLQTLLLGLGGVALVVGGVGIANVMIISVLERRSEIGLRRALGATRRHIATQFVLESATLAGLGGVLGAALGATVTIGYARQQGWLISLPLRWLAAANIAALVLGAMAGVYPAIRAARLDPAEAISPAS